MYPPPEPYTSKHLSSNSASSLYLYEPTTESDNRTTYSTVPIMFIHLISDSFIDRHDSILLNIVFCHPFSTVEQAPPSVSNWQFVPLMHLSHLQMLSLCPVHWQRGNRDSASQFCSLITVLLGGRVISLAPPPRVESVKASAIYCFPGQLCPSKEVVYSKIHSFCCHRLCFKLHP